MLLKRTIQVWLENLLLLNRNIVSIFFLLLGIVSAQSDISKVGTTAGTLLEMPVSARGLALGNSMAGMAADGTVFYWNPALATELTAISMSASYIPWLVETQVQHFSIVIPTNYHWVFGASISTWSMDDMKVRTELEQDGTGQYFDAGDMVIALSGARNLTDKFSVGLNIKFLQERIWHSSANGLALDFGTLYRTDLLNGLKIIATLNNYGSSMKLDGRDLDLIHDPDPTGEGNNEQIPSEYRMDIWSLPMNFRFGLATEIVRNNLMTLSVEVDAIHPSNNYESIDLGLELAVKKMVFLRLGYSSLFQIDSIEGISMGVGIKISTNTGSFTVDYGYRDYGHLSILNALTINVIW